MVWWRGDGYVILRLKFKQEREIDEDRMRKMARS